VNIHSTRYAIARRYMIRHRRDDFANPHEIARFAAAAHLSLEQFRDEFESLVRDEPPPLDIALPTEAGDGALSGSTSHG
jgi:ATP-dependent phosphofructokinase / diphosphate-dependent phosphofructokinase